jgi:hypothetical protein
VIKPLEEPYRLDLRDDKEIVRKINEIIAVLNEIINDLGLKIRHAQTWKDEYPD